MGQKVNPLNYRLPLTLDWQSRWFAKGDKAYQKLLLEDFFIRRMLMDRLRPAGIVRVQIDRLITRVIITLYVSRPGVVIGRGGTGLDLLKQQLVRMVSVPQPDKNLELDVVEVKNPETSAYLVAIRIGEQLEKRFPYRRVATKAIERIMSSGGLGVRIHLTGRVAGAEIGRSEKFQQGKVPLQTLRADIDYAQLPAFTKSGYIGVKVWIYKGEKSL